MYLANTRVVFIATPLPDVFATAVRDSVFPYSVIGTLCYLTDVTIVAMYLISIHYGTSTRTYAHTYTQIRSKTRTRYPPSSLTLLSLQSNGRYMFLPFSPSTTACTLDRRNSLVVDLRRVLNCSGMVWNVWNVIASKELFQVCLLSKLIVVKSEGLNSFRKWLHALQFVSCCYLSSSFFISLSLHLLRTG